MHYSFGAKGSCPPAVWFILPTSGSELCKIKEVSTRAAGHCSRRTRTPNVRLFLFALLLLFLLPFEWRLLSVFPFVFQVPDVANGGVGCWALPGGATDSAQQLRRGDDGRCPCSHPAPDPSRTATRRRRLCPQLLTSARTPVFFAADDWNHWRKGRLGSASQRRQGARTVLVESRSRRRKSKGSWRQVKGGSGRQNVVGVADGRRGGGGGREPTGLGGKTQSPPRTGGEGGRGAAATVETEAATADSGFDFNTTTPSLATTAAGSWSCGGGGGAAATGIAGASAGAGTGFNTTGSSGKAGATETGPSGVPSFWRRTGRGGGGGGEEEEDAAEAGLRSVLASTLPPLTRRRTGTGGAREGTAEDAVVATAAGLGGTVFVTVAVSTPSLSRRTGGGGAVVETADTADTAEMTLTGTRLFRLIRGGRERQAVWAARAHTAAVTQDELRRQDEHPSRGGLKAGLLTRLAASAFAFDDDDDADPSPPPLMPPFLPVTSLALFLAAFPTAGAFAAPCLAFSSCPSLVASPFSLPVSSLTALTALTAVGALVVPACSSSR